MNNDAPQTRRAAPRPLRWFGAGPEHPGRGVPSQIVVRVGRGDRVETIELTPEQAAQAIERLALALRVVVLAPVR